MSSDVAGHMRLDIALVYFAKKRRCSEIASTHVVDERVKSAARCFRYIDFDVRVNLSGDRGKVFIQEGFAFCFGIRFTGNDVFSCMPVTYSPYANDIFVWYVADTFQTIVTTDQ